MVRESLPQRGWDWRHRVAAEGATPEPLRHPCFVARIANEIFGLVIFHILPTRCFDGYHDGAMPNAVIKANRTVVGVGIAIHHPIADTLQRARHTGREGLRRTIEA
jgi:hypothetical protein